MRGFAISAATEAIAISANFFFVAMSYGFTNTRGGLALSGFSVRCCTLLTCDLFRRISELKTLVQFSAFTVRTINRQTASGSFGSGRATGNRPSIDNNLTSGDTTKYAPELGTAGS
jgi:hypothetical protein